MVGAPVVGADGDMVGATVLASTVETEKSIRAIVEAVAMIADRSLVFPRVACAPF